ncbi:eukaryotic translation initiation factor 3 subunit J, partial [Sporodiniella umbellata]
MSDWEEEIDIQVAAPKKNQWDDEDVEDDVKDDWEDSEEEKPEVKKVAAAPIKKKVPLKQKIAEKQAAEEQKKKELEEKKKQGQSDDDEEEDAYERAQRLRQLELEADMISATDLFKGVSIEDMKGKPIEEWKPKNRVELDTYRKRLVEIISASSKSINYGWVIDELLRDIAVPLKDTEVKKVAASLTAIANEKQKQAKDALKKTKGKSKPQLAAAGKSGASESKYNDMDDDYDDDFM